LLAHNVFVIQESINVIVNTYNKYIQMNWLCRPLSWKSKNRKSFKEQQNSNNIQHEQPRRKRRGKGGDVLVTVTRTHESSLFAPPDSPIGSSKNDQSQQLTKNETTITTLNQSQNEALSSELGDVDPCGGIPLEVVRRDAFASTADDDISMMSCSIMRSSYSDPLETWMEGNANAKSFQWQRIKTAERYQPKMWENSSQEDDFTRVSI
jgi:hypothetical protein